MSDQGLRWWVELGQQAEFEQLFGGIENEREKDRTGIAAGTVPCAPDQQASEADEKAD